MHLTGGRNTGFRKIRNALRRNGSPEPLFETDEERTYFATTLFIQPEFLDQPARVYDRVYDGVSDLLDELDRKILTILSHTPSLTYGQLADETVSFGTFINQPILSATKSRPAKERLFLFDQQLCAYFCS